MMKNLQSFFGSVLLIFLVFVGGNSFAQTNLYTEGTDLSNSCCGSTFNISSAGTYTVVGTLLTTSDGADWFQVSVGSGLQLDNVQYSFTGPSSFDGGINFAGLGSASVLGTGSGSVSIAPFSYPLSSGTYFTQVFANFSVGNGWTMTYTVSSACTAPSITGNPVNVTTCAGATATFTSSASGSPSPTVQWQVSTNGGVSYSNIAGATSTTLSFTTTASQTGNKYRAVFTNSCGSATTTAATLTVNSAPSVTTNPGSPTVCSGSTATFTAAASGSPSPTVQWQQSTDGGVTYSNISGATSTTLSFTSTASQNGNRYRAVFTNTCGSATTTGGILTVNVASAVTTNPVSSTVCPSSTATFTAAASGTPSPTVQWQISIDGGVTYNNISGATSTTLSFTAVAADNGTKYRAVFTNTCGTATTTAATLTIGVSPSITTNPNSSTICSGSSATFTAAASGTPAPTVQWQKSTDGGATYNNISGATSTTLSFTTAGTDNGNKYRAVFTNICGVVISSAADLAVTTGLPSITGNPVDQTICSSIAPVSLSSSGSNFSSVQWQVSTDGGSTWSNIAFATTPSLTYVTNFSNGWKFRAAYTNVCGTSVTTAMTLTVGTAPAVTTDPTSSSVCLGSSAIFTAAASGTPVPTVQWQKSTDGGVTYNNIAGATTTNLSFTTTLADDASMYHAVFTNTCGTATSNAATLTISTVPSITTNPTSQLVCNGATATFTAAATGIGLGVQWQVSTNGGSSYSDIPGATSATLSFTVAVADNGKLYRAHFTNGCGNQFTSGATLTVGTPPTTSNPASISICSGSLASFSVTTTGTPTVSIQWQVSTDGGASFNSVPVGGTGNTLTFTAAGSDDGKQYRVKVTTACGTVLSTAATLNVSTAATAVTKNPTAQSICPGNTVTFIAAASGTPAPAAQWQVSTDGGLTYNDISGATNYTLSFATAAADNGKQYRVKFSNACGIQFTTAAVLTIYTTPTVTTNPTAQSACAGSAVSFSAGATGNPGVTCQWQVSTDAGITFNTVAGATSTTYTFTAAAADNGKIFRAVFVNGCGSAFTTGAVLTVGSTVAVTTNPSNQSTCPGAPATFDVASTGSPAASIQWQVSTDGGSTFSNIVGATGASLSFNTTIADNGKVYRASLTNVCGTVLSTSALLTVSSGSPVVSSNPTNQTVCAGATVTFTTAATSTPLPSVQWQSSSDGGATFSNIAGATNTSYVLTTAGADNGKLFRAAFLNACGSAFSTAATLTVSSGAPVIITNPISSQMICAGAPANFSAAATATPTPTVQWQVSTDGGTTFGDIAGATNTNFSITTAAIDDGKIYRASFSNVCGTTTTSGSLLNISSGTPVVTANPSNQIVCAGAAVTFISTATSIPTPTVQWQVSTDGGTTFSNIAGATSNSYTFTTVGADNSKLFRASYLNLCGSSFSSSALLTVGTATPAITANPVASQMICPGAPVSFSAAATGILTPTVQWQVSTDGGTTFSNIAGATSTTFTFTTVAADNGKIYRAGFTNVCGTSYTTTSLLNISSGAPVVTVNPASQTVCAGAVVTFSSNATSTPANTVQWQVSTDGGITFSNIAGATSTSFTLTTAGADNGKRYRAQFTGLCGFSYSTSALLTVGTGTATITTNPVAQIVCAGAMASFTAAATGVPAPTAVQWQVSTDGGTTFSNIAGATNTAFNITTVAADNGKIYRAAFTNICGSSVTTGALLTVGAGAPVVTTNPSSQAVCVGSLVIFTAQATSSPSPTIQWQLSTDGGTTFNNIAGATNTVFSFTTATSDNGKMYRAQFTNICGSIESSVATLTVGTGVPVITGSPSAQTICAGTPVTFTASATGFPTPTVQWQVSANGGVTWSPIAGATSSLYTFTTAGTDNGKLYRATFTNVCGTTLGQSVALTVGTVPPTVTTNPATQSVCTGATVTFTSIATGFPTPTEQWQVSTDGGVTYSNIVGATNINYSFVCSFADNNKRYRAVFTTVCGSTYSVSATLNVGVPAVITGSPSSITVCSGTPVTFTSGGTGSPTPTIQWEVSPNGGLSWNALPGQTSANYSFVATNLNNGYKYRAVYTNYCATVITSVATLTVNSLPAITSQPSDTRVCDGQNASFTTVATGTGITYQWQVNTGTGFVNVPAASPYAGANTSSLKVLPADKSMSGYTYRCVVTGTCPPIVISNVVTLTVDTLPAIISQSPSVATCQYTPTTFSVTAVGTDRTYQWFIKNTLGGPGSYIALADGPDYLGSTSATLTIRKPLASLDGTIYHCTISGRCNPSVTTADDTLTVHTEPHIISQTSPNVTICNTANDSFKVIATGTALTYQWQISTDKGANWSNMTNGLPYGGVTSATLTITSAGMTLNNNQYRVIVSGTCAPPDTSDPIMLSITNNTTWTGQADNKWSNIANWSCGVLPIATTEVYISKSAPNMPVIDIPGAVCDSIFFDDFTSLSFIGTSNKLNIKGSPICDHCVIDGTKGDIVYSGSKTQLVLGGFTYGKIEMAGSGNKILVRGDLMVDVSLTMTSSYLVLGDNNAIIGSNATIIGGSNTSSIVTLGKGQVKVENVGASGKTSDQFVPLSDGTSYAPISFSNSGLAGEFSTALYNNINSTYDPITLMPVSDTNAYTGYAVGKSWLLTSTSDSPNVKMTLNWNASDELTDFNREACYLSTYAYPDWGFAQNITHAIGADPYSLTMSGLTKMTVFGVTSAVPNKTSMPRNGIITVYPNPVSNTLKVKFTGTPGRNVNIYIVNSFGREVYRVTVNPYDYMDGVVPVSVLALDPDVYTITTEDVDNNSEIRSARFVKP